MTRQLDPLDQSDQSNKPLAKQTLPGAGSVGQPPGRNTLPLGSGNQAHPDSFSETLVSEPHAKEDLSSLETLATDALPPADPGTLSALATVQATAPGDPGWDSMGDGQKGSPTTSLDQTTVLPRVELDGATAKVLHSSRRRYETHGKLGEGGVGEVVSALDHDIGRSVAIKRLRARMKSPMALARFVGVIH